MKLSDVVNHRDFMLAVSTFLDDFRKCENKYALVKDEPLGEHIDTENLCLLAAIVHKLSNEYGFAPPSWVNSPRYIMSHSAYAHGTINKEYQRYLTETTPVEFAMRNIFYGANVIDRI
jgi:hypothetical protein